MSGIPYLHTIANMFDYYYYYYYYYLLYLQYLLYLLYLLTRICEHLKFCIYCITYSHPFRFEHTGPTLSPIHLAIYP